MGGKKLVARNTVWNCLGMAVEMAIGFLLAPYLILQLGDTTYGLWIVIGSLTSYFGLLDLGVRASVGRQVAFHRARSDRARLDETLSTSAAVLGGIGAVAAAGVALTSLAVFYLFKVTPEQAAGARVALLLVGLNLGLSLIAGLFDAALWGCQRFDVLNGIGILSALARVSLTVFAVSQGGRLVALALITLSLTVATGAAKVFFTWHEDPAFRLRTACITRRALKELFGYGIWSFLVSVTLIVRMQLGPVLIGSLLGVALVTPYALANRLAGYLMMVLVAVTGVLTPFATRLFATEDNEGQQRLLTEGGKYCFLLTLYLTILMVFLGKPLIALWVAARFTAIVPLLVVLVAGEFLANTQHVTRVMITAAARHRLLAYLCLLELGGVVVLTVVLVKPFGLIGVGVSLVFPGVFCRGLLPLLFVCRMTRLSAGRYLSEAVVPALACSGLPALTLAAATTWSAPESWAALIGYGVAYTLLFGLACVLLLCGGVPRLTAAKASGNVKSPLSPEYRGEGGKSPAARLNTDC